MLILQLVLMSSGRALAEPAPAPPPPNVELLEFLGSFETENGPWHELNDALDKKPAANASPAPLPKEKAKQ